jgi:tetratricopeptide (TPR) repeat protein
VSKENAMRVYTLILLLFVSSTLFGQRAIRQANKLIAAKKYRSAWEVLDKADPKNEKPVFALAKTELLLKYFVNTVMHQVFTLKDLKANEKVDDLRGKDENGNLIHFNPEEVLDTLLKKHPKEYTLYVGLGDYYYETFIIFQENWIKKPEVLVNLITENYKQAAQHGLLTYQVAYRIGFSQLFLQRFPEARKSFDQAILLNPKYPDSYYSQAYTCLQLNMSDSALANANKAYELFTDTFNRSDVNLLRGLIYSSRKDTARSLGEYRQAAKMNPKNGSIWQLLLKAVLRFDTPDLHDVASAYFDIDPRAADTYSQLINGYFQAQRSKDILTLLGEKLVQYEKDPEVLGNICFYRAYIYVIMEDKPKAKADILKAKENFKKVFPPEHEMFGAIEEALKELDKE